MELYKFETDKFGISEKGIHLLRNKFNYKTIYKSEIDSIFIEKGKQVNNWLLLLVVGLILCSFGLYWSIKLIYEFFFANNVSRFYYEQFILPIFPVFMGVYSVYTSLQRGLIMIVVTNKKVMRFPIGKLNGKLQIERLIALLYESELAKDKVSVNVPNR